MDVYMRLSFYFKCFDNAGIMMENFWLQVYSDSIAQYFLEPEFTLEDVLRLKCEDCSFCHTQLFNESFYGLHNYIFNWILLYFQ